MSYRETFMPLAFWFWLFMVLWFVFAGVFRYRAPVPGIPYYYWFSGHLLEFLALVILGWQVFGSPLASLIK